MWQVRFNSRLLRQTRSNLDELKKQILRRGMKDALMKAATPGVKAAKANAPTDTGALRKSITKKGSTDPTAQTAHVKVGAASGQRTSKNGETRTPSRYAHLVEFGHHAPDGSFVPAQPFLRPAFEGEKEQMKQIYADSIGDDTMRHAERLNRRLARRRNR